MLIWPCMSGHLAWLLFSDKIFFHAFQVGADAAPQAGAAPLSADMAFKDMTSHCEALTVGKQQKMSAFMSFQQSVQASGLPSSQPHDMELALFQDQQLPQVQYLPFSRPFLCPHRIHFKMNAMQNKVLSIDINDPNCEQTTARSTNPFADENLQSYPQVMNAPNGENPHPQPGQDCQQEFLKLPAASPYDNFLRAAGC